MYSILLLLFVLTAFCPKELVDGFDVAESKQPILRYTSDISKHKIENSEQYREEELDGFLKTGKLPAISEETLHAPKKESSQKGVAKKEPKVPTEVLMKQFIDGGKHIKNHLNATGRGRGPDTNMTESPAKAPSQGKVKGKLPPAVVTKKEMGKKKYPPPPKAPKGSKGKVKKDKVAKKGGKQKKDQKGFASDYPSTSPTPTLPPATGDVVLSPTLDSPTSQKFDGTSPPNVDTGVNGRSFNGPTEVPNDGNNDSPSSSSNSSTVAKVVSPLAAFAGLLILGGFMLSRRRSSKENIDGNENLMKHTREGFDVETGTVSGNTYRTGVFTEDDGTLEGSVDVSEGQRNHKMSHKHLNEMENVVKDLEEVSLGDDGASTNSVSSGAYACANSCDSRLIDAVRASMTSEAFKPDKSRVYDASIKPEWASRSKATEDSETCQPETDHANRLGGPEFDATSAPSLDDSSTKSVSYKKFIQSSPHPEEDKTSHEVACESLWTVPDETETMHADVTDCNRNETSSWMKAQLRPISNTPQVPKNGLLENLASNDDNDSEPEWMKKFRQMGLEKKD